MKKKIAKKKTSRRGLTGYKAVILGYDFVGDHTYGIAVLRIHPDTRVRWMHRITPASQVTAKAKGTKLRAEEARVIRLETVRGKVLPKKTIAISMWERNFTYISDTHVLPNEEFDEHVHKECASGIHFFMTREEAVEWTK